MNAILIAIGDEILIGQTLDTNTQYLAQNLNKLGIEITQIKTIPDTQFAILNELKNLEEDILIFTGGLGPTKDDITKKTLADFFNTPLIESKEVLQNIQQLFEKFTKRKRLNTYNIQQAYVPENAQILMNKVGTAPGMWFEENHKIIISIPGIPFEMKYLTQQHIIPRLEKIAPPVDVFRKIFLVLGVPESQLAERLHDWENQLEDATEVAYLPTAGLVKMRITIRNRDEKFAMQSFKKIYSQLSEILGDKLLSIEGDDLPTIIKHICLNKKIQIASAESFTSGKIAEMLTSVSGSSKYFCGSIVAYQTRLKTELLHIPKDFIDTHGVVSKAVAEKMAESIQKITSSDLSIATTGAAGPNTDTYNTEIGKAFITVRYHETNYTKEFNYPFLERTDFQFLLSRKALEMVVKVLTEDASFQ